MEKEINVAEILKDKSKGIRLYSPIFGECAFSFVREETDDICVNQHNDEKAFFNYKGLYNILGECLLFPSKEMRDWDKFAWKKGDVLVNKDKDAHIVFEKFTDDTYTTFTGRHYYMNDGKNKDAARVCCNVSTECYTLETEDVAQSYINGLEKRLGGKLNRETLEIEKQQEFKDGDIVFIRCNRFCYIEIFNYFKDDDLYDYASLSTTLQMIDICGKYPISKAEIVEIRLATDSEKKQLFGALAKEGKAWDAEKKQIVDLKTKWNPKPFDRVVTRVDDNAIWTANIFSHIDQYGEYNTIGCVGGYPYCLPYNEETAKLIGTTNNWDG